MTAEQRELSKKLIAAVFPEKATMLESDNSDDSNDDNIGYLLAHAITIITPKYCVDTWHFDDVVERSVQNEQPLTDRQVYTVLRRLESEHDAEIGINWNTIDYWIDRVYTEAQTAKEVQAA